MHFNCDPWARRSIYDQPLDDRVVLLEDRVCGGLLIRVTQFGANNTQYLTGLEPSHGIGLACGQSKRTHEAFGDSVVGSSSGKGRSLDPKH